MIAVLVALSYCICGVWTKWYIKNVVHRHDYSAADHTLIAVSVMWPLFWVLIAIGVIASAITGKEKA